MGRSGIQKGINGKNYMEIKDWISVLLPILSLILSPILAWALSQRKLNAEVEKIRADVRKTDMEADSILVVGSGNIVKSWEDLAAVMRKDYEKCRSQNELMIQKVTLLEKKLTIYVTAVNDFVGILIEQIEQENPELAKAHRAKFDEVSAILSNV